MFCLFSFFLANQAKAWQGVATIRSHWTQLLGLGMPGVVFILNLFCPWRSKLEKRKVLSSPSLWFYIVLFLPKYLIFSCWFMTYQSKNHSWCSHENSDPFVNVQFGRPGVPWSFRFAAAEWWCRFSGPLGWGWSSPCITCNDLIPNMSDSLVPEQSPYSTLEGAWMFILKIVLPCIRRFVVLLHPKEKRRQVKHKCNWAIPTRQLKSSTSSLEKSHQKNQPETGPQRCRGPVKFAQKRIHQPWAAQESQEVQKNFKKPQPPMPSRLFHCPCGSKEPR